MRSSSAINICSNNKSIYDDEDDYETQLKNTTINNKHRSSVTDLNVLLNNNRKLDSNLFQTNMNSYDNINRENNNELLLDYDNINQQQLSSSNLEFLSDNNNNNNNSNNNSSSSSTTNNNDYTKHNAHKILFANPAFNRFFNPPTTIMQPAILLHKQLNEEFKTTQYSNNNEYHKLRNKINQAALVQGDLLNNNNNKLINNNENKDDFIVSVASVSKTKLKQETEEINNNNNNNLINYSNPIENVKEFSRILLNNNNNLKNNHNNTITNRNSNRIDNRNYNNNSRRTHNYYYYSATESLGEDSDYPSEFESSSIISNSSNIIIKNNHNINNNNNSSKKINGYHYYINNTNTTNSTNRIKQLQKFQLNNNKSLKEIHLQQQQLQQHDKKSHNQNNYNKEVISETKAATAITTTTTTSAAAVVILNTNEIEDNTYFNNTKTTTTNTNNKKISYASITLRQPLKDINYFSDTEGLNKASSSNSNRIRYKHSLLKSNNSKSNLISNNNNNNNNKLEKLNRTLSSSVEISNRNNSNNNQVIDTFSRLYQPESVISKPTMVSMSSNSYMNKQQQQQPQPIMPGQSYSKLGTSLNKPIGYIGQHENDMLSQRSFNNFDNTSTQSYQKWQPSIQQPAVSYVQPQPQQPRYNQYSNQYNFESNFDDEEYYDDQNQLKRIKIIKILF